MTTKSHIGLWFVLLGCLLLTMSGAEPAFCDTVSRLLIYNSVHDVLYGGSGETISFTDLREPLRQYPDDFKLIGIGLGNDPEKLGNYFITGTTGNPIQYRVDAKSPYRMETVSEIHSSFLALAIANNTAVFKRVIENAPNFLALLADQLEKFKHMELAAIRVVGKFTSVQVGVTETMASSGKSRPVMVETVFKQPSSLHWEMAGIYARDQNLQLQVSFPGHPVHLHGFLQDAQRGGHIIFASVERADVYIYPIREFNSYQNDLILSVDRNAGKIKVSVSNVGKLKVEKVWIKVEVPDTSINFRKVVPLMKPEQRVVVEFEETEETKYYPIHIQVDPENLISEVREDNNLIKFPPVARKSSKQE